MKAASILNYTNVDSLFRIQGKIRKQHDNITMVSIKNLINNNNQLFINQSV